MRIKQRRLKLKLLDRIKADLIESYNLTQVEQYYLFHYPEGTTDNRLRTILECRIKFHQSTNTRITND